MLDVVSNCSYHFSNIFFSPLNECRSLFMCTKNMIVIIKCGCIFRAADPNNVQAFENMKQLAFDLHPVDTLGVMRIFSLALNLVNAAEVQHRLRLMREHELALCKNNKVGPLPMLDDSVRGVIEKVIEEGEGDEEAIFEKLLNQKVEIVLTAHPTEVNRKTLLRKCEIDIYIYITIFPYSNITIPKDLELILSFFVYYLKFLFIDRSLNYRKLGILGKA